MARHPEVFVNDLVLMSAQGRCVAAIVGLMRVDEGYVRDVIRAFNERRFEALDPQWSGGRPPAVDDATRQKVVAMAKTDPTRWGCRSRRGAWSSSPSISPASITTVGREAIRRVLRREKVSFQTTTTCKASNTPT